MDGEQRIYFSTHKYQVVEPASLSYLFAEIDKTLQNYEQLIESGKPDNMARVVIKERWIKYKCRVRHQGPDETTLKRLAEQQALFREMESAYKRIEISACGCGS